MEIIGGSEREVDRVIWVDDLTVGTLIALIDRLEQTEKAEQFLFREAELDDAYRQADADVRLAVRDGSDSRTMAGLERVKEIVFAAHDFVGWGKIPEAVRELNKVIEIKIGLDEDANQGG